MKFVKKPIVIEAYQWDGDVDELFKWSRNVSDGAGAGMQYGNKILTIKTLEGSMTVSLNDWIICGIKGEFYPCKPDVFEASYERFEEKESIN